LRPFSIQPEAGSRADERPFRLPRSGWDQDPVYDRRVIRDQRFTIAMTKVEHNIAIDRSSLFDARKSVMESLTRRWNGAAYAVTYGLSPLSCSRGGSNRSGAAATALATRGKDYGRRDSLKPATFASRSHRCQPPRARLRPAGTDAGRV